MRSLREPLVDLSDTTTTLLSRRPCLSLAAAHMVGLYRSALRPPWVPRRARLAAASQFGPIWEVDDQDNQTLMGTDGFSLALVEQRRWDAEMRAAWERQRPHVEHAQAALDEEIAVLRMFAGTLAAAAERVSLAAAGVSQHVGAAQALDESIRTLEASVSRLWQVANGDTDDIPAGHA